MFGWYLHPSSGAHTTVSTAPGIFLVKPLLLPAAIVEELELQSSNSSTYFGWYFCPSSAAHTTVSTASGTCQTVTATCRYRGRVGRVGRDAVDTVMCAPDDGWRYHPKHVEQFPDINKLCNVASCCIYIRMYLRCADP